MLFYTSGKVYGALECSCVAGIAGVRKGRGREFGRETARDGGGVGNLGMRLRAREEG